MLKVQSNYQGLSKDMGPSSNADSHAAKSQRQLFLKGHADMKLLTLVQGFMN